MMAKKLNQRQARWSLLLAQFDFIMHHHCHGPCSVTFFPKNNQRTAPMESPMMATSPLFSATITTGHPCRTYIGAPSEYFPYSDTTNQTCILIIVITNQHHVLSTAAQPQPHHAPHMFHVLGQSHRACTSLEVMSRGHHKCYDFERFRLFAAVILASRFEIEFVRDKRVPLMPKVLS